MTNKPEEALARASRAPRRKRNRFLRFCKRVLYFKPTTFIGTVIATAVITAMIQNLMSKPKTTHRPHLPEAVVQRIENTTTGYMASCYTCGTVVRSNAPIQAVCPRCKAVLIATNMAATQQAEQQILDQQNALVLE